MDGDADNKDQGRDDLGNEKRGGLSRRRVHDVRWVSRRDPAWDLRQDGREVDHVRFPPVLFIHHVRELQKLRARLGNGVAHITVVNRCQRHTSTSRSSEENQQRSIHEVHSLIPTQISRLVMASYPQQSQPRAGPSHSNGPKITGKGKERQKQLIKSNALKRRKVDEELKGLKESIDAFVSIKSCGSTPVLRIADDPSTDL